MRTIRPTPVRAARRLLAVAALLLLVGGVAAEPRVVVSIPPYADLVERVAGPDATVDVLLPAGATPHAYAPSPRDLARLDEADLVVLNGGVDAWAFGLLEGTGRDVPTFVVLDALGSDGAADAEHAGDGPASAAHAHDADGDLDPHVWLDPLLMARVVPALAEALAAVDPERADAYAEAAAQLADDLTALHEELAERLAPVAGAAFVPFHDAWPHFAERYGLDLILEIEPFPGREPSARELAAAVDAVRASGARAIFNEAQLSDRPARVLAAEAGVEVATLDPLGGGPERRRYEDLLRYNAERVAAALSGE